MISSVTVILQYSDSIWACPMSNNTNSEAVKFKIETLNHLQNDQGSSRAQKLNINPTAKLKMIRDHNQTIYFAEQEHSKFAIVQISLKPNNQVERREIYHMQGCRILALEIDDTNTEIIR